MSLWSQGSSCWCPCAARRFLRHKSTGLRWGYPPLNKHSWLKFLDFKHLKIGECSIAMLPEGYLTLPMTSFKSAPSRKSMSSQNGKGVRTRDHPFLFRTNFDATVEIIPLFVQNYPVSVGWVIWIPGTNGYFKLFEGLSPNSWIDSSYENLTLWC